jgi:EAL domain-containing protein (putative c-di-GMP-specific phosphodiesterase class I)/GGDEF domain-containing protein
MTPKQFMQKLLEAYQAFSAGQTDQPSACLCLMLDHWSRLRDQYGYSGLATLIEELLEVTVSTIEMPSHACALNERTVLVLVPECSLKSAEDLAGKVFQRADTEAFSIGQDAAALSISLGFCELDHRFTSADRMLMELVDGTQETMLAGGNAIRKIEPDVSLGQASRSERKMLGLLMESLRKDAMRVLFQPLLATNSESAKSFQILPRLLATDGSLVRAASFVPVARKAKVLGVLDRWMVQRAVQLLVHEYQLLPVRLFLSQGESLLVQPERREWFRRLIEKHPEVSGRLVLDFSIEDALASLKSTSEFMRLAHQLGIQICFSQVDEHSKWDLMANRLRPDYLKMSAQFVERLSQDSALEFDFQRISAPIRKQGTKIIMPMVEDAVVAANLWRTGADYMQGYMIEKETETLELSQ